MSAITAVVDGRLRRFRNYEDLRDFLLDERAEGRRALVTAVSGRFNGD